MKSRHSISKREMDGWKGEVVKLRGTDDVSQKANSFKEEVKKLITF